MSKNSKRIRKPLSSTDIFYKDLYSHLSSDFSSTLGYNFWLESEVNLRSNITAFRQEPIIHGNLSPYYFFKVASQMSYLLKRVRFENDMYTTEELLIDSRKKFVDTQERIARYVPPSYATQLVLAKAKAHVRRILGNYSENEHVSACRFGKRASYGSPLSESFLDRKMGFAMTGSKQHIGWFTNTVLRNDTLLQDAVSSCVPMAPDRYQPVKSLELIGVPKSWKALRMIMPNTTIGSFYTYGLGKVIQDRLVGEGLNIRYLQRKHARLTKHFSKNRSHVTADLSSASDSFTPWLVKTLLPRQWWRVLAFGRLPFVTIDGRCYYLSSFMTMGNGYTFPLQTLLFYSILKGIQELSNAKGIISVYGDDLIYPTTMHRFVGPIFENLGFLLNKEKTFVKENFRESCGADYFNGIDVRPFQPEAQPAEYGKMRYLSVLYKTINGLRRKWYDEEIPSTILWLKREILRCTPTMHYVPSDFPDYAGIRTNQPIGETVRSLLHGNSCFSFLSMTRKKRPVIWQLPYYWDTLRSKESTVDDWSPFDISDKSTLQWCRVNLKYSWRSPCTGRRFHYRLRPMVVSKAGKDTLTISYSSTYCWDRSIDN